MNVDEMIRVWAAKRLELDPSEVKSVEFKTVAGFWYSEVTYEGAYSEALVKLVAGGKQRTIYLGGEDYVEELPDLLAEIMAACNP